MCKARQRMESGSLWTWTHSMGRHVLKTSCKWHQCKHSEFVQLSRRTSWELQIATGMSLARGIQMAIMLVGPPNMMQRSIPGSQIVCQRSFGIPRMLPSTARTQKVSRFVRQAMAPERQKFYVDAPRLFCEFVIC